MTGEEIKYFNKDGQGTIDIISAAINVNIVIVNKPILITYCGCVILIDYLTKEFLQEFELFSDCLAVKKIDECQKELDTIMKHFKKGNYLISKKVIPSSSTHLISYQINYPKKWEKKNEAEALKLYNSYYSNSEGQTFLDPTVDHLLGEWTNVISLHKKESDFQNRVDFYKLKIKNGEYPYCMFYAHTSENYRGGLFFSLEHSAKIQAYYDLEISPRIIEISKVECQDAFDIFNNTEYLYDKLYDWHSRSIFNWLTTEEYFLKQIMNSDHPFSKYVKYGYAEERYLNGNIKSKGNYINHKPDGVIERYFENGKIQVKELYDNGKYLRPIEEYFQSGQIYIQYVLEHTEHSSKMTTYSKDGSLDAEDIYNKGKYGESEMFDGPSSVVYHMNGKICTKNYFKDGKCCRFQEFDDFGELIEDVEY